MGLPEAVFGFAVGALIAGLAAGVAADATGFKSASGSATPVAVTAAELAGLWVALVGTVLWASRRRGTGRLGQDFGWRRGRWWDLPLGAVIGVACQYGLLPLVYLPFEHVDHHLSTQLSKPVHSDTAAAHGAGAGIAVLLLLAVGAPLVEELFFRGLVLRSLLSWLPAPGAIVVSGILFGLAHWEGVQFPGLALFGVILGIVAYRTGRLTAGIGAHAAFNAVAVLSVVSLR
jgi:hypothetical protein